MYYICFNKTTGQIYLKIGITKHMKTLTRLSVINRENFLKSVYQPILGKKFSEVPINVWKKGNRALDLLLEIQSRYESDAKMYQETQKVEITWEMITGNGKYSLD
ncbi:hypothetical protein D1632_15600 [Chryseobacterium nematophagum]|uniref:Uncharacterized protein n=2 Tax=Chryseobacterium TaxID=59732 RepID=A0A3M7L9T8_9FLAO|nr:hypothetical protein D1632_15600 [Chryseobacterium nematophagum]